MYRLLIVDDEPFIVKGLTHLCEHTSRLELEVEQAYSAASALDKLERAPVDIVLTDIRMPGQSGLELQKEIRRRWPRTKVIFLTGHDDFTYIQEATRDGSADYILKTEGNDAVLAAIRRTVEQLEEEFNTSRLLAQAEQRQAQILPLLQRQLLLELLHGQEGTEKDEEYSGVGRLRSPEPLNEASYPDRAFKELSLELSGEVPCLLVLCRIDERAGGSRGTKARLGYALEQLARELLESSARMVAVEYEPFRSAWLIQGLDADHDAGGSQQGYQTYRLNLIKHALEQVQNRSRNLLGLRISLAVAGSWSSWTDVPHKFEELKLLLGSGLGCGEESLLIEHETQAGTNLPERTREAAARTAAKKVELMRSSLEQRDQQAFMRLLEDLVSSTFEERSPAGTLDKITLYYQVVSLYLPYIRQVERALEPEQEGRYIDLGRLTRYDSHLSWHDAAVYFRQIADVLFQCLEQGRNEQQHEVIDKVNRYIEQNLAGDLSLTQIGDEVGHNPSYLSRLYKQVTGQGLSEAITAAKLAKAKQLLEETTDKIHEIAAAVGFVSPPYFYRFFKTATHLTPQEYREIANK